jgi:hypothetical protein
MDDLARHLAVLGSAPRLHILEQLRTPRRLMDIRLPRADGARGARAHLARQSVQEHVQKLVAAGFLLQETTPDKLVTYRTDVARLEGVLANLRTMTQALGQPERRPARIVAPVEYAGITAMALFN